MPLSLLRAHYLSFFCLPVSCFSLFPTLFTSLYLISPCICLVLVLFLPLSLAHSHSPHPFLILSLSPLIHCHVYCVAVPLFAVYAHLKYLFCLFSPLCSGEVPSDPDVQRQPDELQPGCGWPGGYLRHPLHLQLPTGTPAARQPHHDVQSAWQLDGRHSGMPG